MIFLFSYTDGLNKCRCIVAVIFSFFWQQSLLASTFECATFPDFNGNKRFGRCVFCCPGARNQFVETWQTVSSAANQRLTQSYGILTMPYFNERHLQHVSVHMLIIVDLNERFTAGARKTRTGTHVCGVFWFYVRGCLVDWWIRSIISTEASHFPLCCEASRPTWVHYVLLAGRNDGGGKDDTGPNKHSKVLSEACPFVSGRCTLIGLWWSQQDLEST